MLRVRGWLVGWVRSYFQLGNRPEDPVTNFAICFPIARYMEWYDNYKTSTANSRNGPTFIDGDGNTNDSGNPEQLAEEANEEQQPQQPQQQQQQQQDPSPDDEEDNPGLSKVSEDDESGLRNQPTSATNC